MFSALGTPKTGECDKISYSVAIKRKPKNSKAFWITPVTWDGAPIEHLEVELKSLGTVRIVKPVELPRGYRMEWHQSWADLLDCLYGSSNCEQCSFAEFDAIVSDFYTFREVVGGDFDIPVWDDHRFDDQWCDRHCHHICRLTMSAIRASATASHLQTFGEWC